MFTSIRIGFNVQGNKNRSDILMYDIEGILQIDNKFHFKVGFHKEGDVVSILGDTNTGLIIFKMCDKVLYSGYYDIQNKDKDIELVPYIRYICPLTIL